MLKFIQKALRVLCLIGLGLSLFSIAPAHAQKKQSATAKTKFYKWVDDKGVTQYTEHLPQESTGRATAKMSPQGTIIKETDRALTPGERLAIAEAARKKEEDAKLQKEEDRKNVAVLSSYSTEKDIDSARERALQSNEEVIKSAQHNVEAASKRRVELHEQSAKYKTIPPKLGREIESNESDLKNQQQLLDTKKREAQQIITRYDEDKRRFTRLTKPQGPTTSTASTTP